MSSRADYQRKWQALNSERCAAYTAKYRANNPLKSREAVDRYNANNRAKIIAAKRARYDAAKAAAYYLKNRERILLVIASYRVRNKSKIAARNESYRILNRDRVRASKRDCRIRRRYAIADKTISPAQWSEIKSRFGNLCAYCNEAKPLTMDHVVPLSRGGRHLIENIAPACVSCNCKKNNKTADEFSAWKKICSIVLA